MRWMNVRKSYPNQWLVIEAVKARSGKTKRLLDKIDVLATCSTGSVAMQKYRRLHKKHPDREFYFVHTSRKQLNIEVRQWLGVRRGHAATTAR